MIGFGKWIAKHKTLIVVLSIVLLIPAAIGFVNTRVNYDLLNYLPENLETVEGQDILLDEFGMGAFSMVVVENMDLKDVQTLKEKMKEVEHVKDVFWYDSLLDITVPMEMLPEDIKEAFNSGDATMMVVLFDTSTSADETMDAIDELRSVTDNQCFISGMSSIVTDVRNLSNKEVPIYVLIACILSLIVLGLAMESFVVPFLFLLSIGMAILYNMGTNLFLGEISYVTQSLAAVLQLAVTMDYSIFLLNSYEENKERFEGDKDRAMAHAISNTFKSVAGSSVTTVAGFLALCFMTFTLGMNIGIVMAKGVVVGVISCITVLPAFILTFDKLIDKTTHRSLIPNLSKASNFITKYHIGFIVIFLLMIFPAIYGNKNVNVYYNMDKTLPADLPSSQANTKLDEDFSMNAMHMVMLKNDMTAKDKKQMIDEMKSVDGVKWVVGLNSLVGPAIPESMIPKDAKKMLKSDNYEIMFVSSDYKTATDKVNVQIDSLNTIAKKYSENNMVIGEAPLTKDLIDITAVDFRNVSIVSIGAIFIIILIIFKSISLPIILVSVIEFSILVNMAVSYYTGVTLPFIASIVIGTIQLGATVDYAILMTSKYQKLRNSGISKTESISAAHKSSMKSILISGLSFFAATFGVGLYSEIDMISSLCTLLSRGAIISTIVVICVLPAMFMIFDPVICKTSIGFGPKKNRI
ncbi:MAG: RND family transporter [Velocimicrobium sp.]